MSVTICWCTRSCYCTYTLESQEVWIWIEVKLLAIPAVCKNTIHNDNFLLIGSVMSMIVMDALLKCNHCCTVVYNVHHSTYRVSVSTNVQLKLTGWLHWPQHFPFAPNWNDCGEQREAIFVHINSLKQYTDNCCIVPFLITFLYYYYFLSPL